MKLTNLIQRAIDKKQFQTIEDYIDFCQIYLEFIELRRGKN